MALTIEYSTRFIRAFRKLEEDLQEEVIEKVKLLKDPKAHVRLKVHKLDGRLKGIWSFSVNFRIRITFFKPRKNIIVLETVGTHDEVY